MIGATLKRRRIFDIAKPTRGDLVVEFIHTLKVPDGPDAGRPFVLRDWQINDIKKIYDPVKQDKDGVLRRVVRQAVDTKGRKNGKTTQASGLLLTHMVGPEAQWNSQCYSAAFEREQAGLIYRAAQSMVLLDDELAAICRCVETAKRIHCAANASTYHALSAESRSKHGLNPAFILFDELAQFGTDRRLFDVLMTSQGAQVEPLMLTLSTQAANDEAILSQLIDYGREVKAGTVKDPSFILIEYSTPPDEELEQEGLTVWDEKVWKRANPALGDFRSIQEMREVAIKAKRIPSLEMTFRNLYLNQRTAQRTSFISPSVWATGNETPSPSEMEGRPAVIAIDLSARLDLTAVVAAVEMDDGRYGLDCRIFTPEDTLEERSIRDRANYRDWVDRGFLFAVPGKSIDYEFVINKALIPMFQMYDVRKMAFDRWRFDQFKKSMSALEFVVDENILIAFGQGFKDMSPAVEAFEELLLQGRLLHGGHPVLRWSVANAVLEKDAAGNKKLTKAKSYGRIDPLVGSVMSVGAFVGGGKVDADMPGIGYV